MAIRSSMRKALFWYHLSAGMLVGFWVVFMATTGALIVFQAELIRSGEQRYQVADPAASGCVSPSLLRSTAQAQAGTQADCPVHHPKATNEPTTNAADSAKWKAEQDKQRRDEAISKTTGIRVLAAIGNAVSVRLMKRDLLFVVERLAGMLDENRLAMVAKQHGIKKAKDNDSVAKLFAAFLRCAEESLLGRLMVELTIVLAASRNNPPQVLKDAAAVYKVDTDAIAAKVRQEFAAKEKAKKATTVAPPKPPAKVADKPRQVAA